MEPAVVIDLGSGYIKAGYSGDDAPRAVFPSIVGRPINPGIMVGMDAKDCFVGDFARSKRGILDLRYPIEHGMFLHNFENRRNPDDFEKLINHTIYDELRLSELDNRPLCFLDRSIGISNMQREKLCTLTFEKYEAKAFHVGDSSVYGLYGTGQATGLVVDIGHGVSSSVLVESGNVYPRTYQRRYFGGRAIVDYLVKILSERGYEMTTSAERDIVEDIKEKLCYVSSDYESELVKSESTAHCESEYTLCDGSKMTVGSERFRAPEILFRPSFLGSEESGVTNMFMDTLKEVDLDLRYTSSVVGNVVLVGGSTLFEGFTERFRTDVVGRSWNSRKMDTSLRVRARGERKFLPWIGASTLLRESNICNIPFVNKSEFEDSGPSIVLRKFVCPSDSSGFAVSYFSCIDKLKQAMREMDSEDNSFIRLDLAEKKREIEMLKKELRAKITKVDKEKEKEEEEGEEEELGAVSLKIDHFPIEEIMSKVQKMEKEFSELEKREEELSKVQQTSDSVKETIKSFEDLMKELKIWRDEHGDDSRVEKFKKKLIQIEEEAKKSQVVLVRIIGESERIQARVLENIEMVREKNNERVMAEIGKLKKRASKIRKMIKKQTLEIELAEDDSDDDDFDDLDLKKSEEEIRLLRERVNAYQEKLDKIESDIAKLETQIL